MPKKTRSCPDFVAMLKSGQPAASLTEQIIECFSSEMHKAAIYRCKNPTQAEDAFQDTVELVIGSLDGFRGDASLRTWLYRLVNSSCARMQRGRKNNPKYNKALEDLPADVESESGQPGQEVQLLISERLDILGRVLEEIGEPNRELFLLHEGQEVSLSELADKFGLSIDGIKSRLKRTRARLRARLLEVTGGKDII
ncbi:MAG: sigma-70 family RNA polymerase sigma factor [Deltaproteobacteria bacterium]|nr:sigma-70 family RNA polymerase sigma factor [Deltaproteobacteria bacterium]